MSFSQYNTIQYNIKENDNEELKMIQEYQKNEHDAEEEEEHSSLRENKRVEKVRDEKEEEDE